MSVEYRDCNGTDQDISSQLDFINMNPEEVTDIVIMPNSKELLVSISESLI